MKFYFQYGLLQQDLRPCKQCQRRILISKCFKTFSSHDREAVKLVFVFREEDLQEVSIAVTQSRQRVSRVLSLFLAEQFSTLFEFQPANMPESFPDPVIKLFLGQETAWQ